MKTTSIKKAINALYREERTENVFVSWKEVLNNEIVERRKSMRAWEAINLLENINKLAFIWLYIAE